MRPIHSILFFFFSFPSALSAQCADPTPPLGGFPVSTVTDRLVTYSDGFKTRADYRYPSANPGSCGWPMLVLVHGFPGTKSGGGLISNAISFAKLGFFVVTYDVRGQGSSIALNPGKGTVIRRSRRAAAQLSRPTGLSTHICPRYATLPSIPRQDRLGRVPQRRQS